MKRKRILLTLVIAAFLSACSTKQYMKQESAMIVLKTPTLKYADLGFIYKNNDETKVEIYGSGQVLMKFTISDTSICMSLFECMDKKSFNKHILSAYYPQDILNHIFRGEQIFDGAKSIKTRNGFTQHLVKDGDYHIKYSVLNNQILFHDTINNILIKIKRLQ